MPCCRVNNNRLGGVRHGVRLFDKSTFLSLNAGQMDTGELPRLNLVFPSIPAAVLIAEDRSYLIIEATTNENRMHYRPAESVFAKVMTWILAQYDEDDTNPWFQFEFEHCTNGLVHTETAGERYILLLCHMHADGQPHNHYRVGITELEQSDTGSLKRWIDRANSLLLGN
ncbi:MAG: hypothetical protein RL150_233 [Candidatus Parcubacteria bacterium]|jgi:hypothetical protein